MELVEALFALIKPASVLIFVVCILVTFRKRVFETLLAAENQGHNVVCAELRQQLRCLTAECIFLREQQAHLEQVIQDKNLIIDRLQHKMCEIEEHLSLSNQRIAVLSSQRDVSETAIHNGILLWKIDDFQKKWQGAVNGIDWALFSPPFYSAQHGYKMCAVIFLNGAGAGERSHLSLFFVVMRGDYDALQTWPFQKKVTMKLLDQGNGDDKVKEFHSNPQSSSFQRPTSDMNIPSGFPFFMPLSELNNRQYIKDDDMFIKVIVD